MSPSSARRILPGRLVDALRRASLGRKLLFLSAVYLVILIAVLALARASVVFQSDMRAAVAAEGQWSKSQKDAVYHLVRFTTSQRQEDYQEFRSYLEVPLGDRQAREALERTPRDLEAAERGFRAGQNHPRDVAGLIALVVRFSWYPRLAEAIETWKVADVVLDDLMTVGAGIREDVANGRLDEARQAVRLLEIDRINTRLTQLENDFSSTLGRAARETTLLVSLVGLVFSGLAVALAVYVSVGISHHIVAAVGALRDGARRVGARRFDQPIVLSSQDELGELAAAFNAMSEALVSHIGALQKAHAALAELDRLKTQFFANVSHELRTPLTLILGPLEQLLARGDLPDPLRADIRLVERNALLLLKQVNDLLDLSRLDAGRMEPSFAITDVGALVSRVASYFEGLAAEREIRFAVSADSGVFAEIDADEIERVVLNLLSNSFKFTPGAGRIRIEVGALDGQVRVAVCDSGPGVPADLRDAVFERFRQLDGEMTRQRGGTGLGLAISRDFVVQHGGRIEVRDSDLGGACFEVVLPRRAAAERAPATEAGDEAVRRARVATYLAELSQEAEGHPAQPATEGSAAGRGECPRVLVVEDNPAVRAFLADGLGDEFEVELAENGRRGLEAVRRRRPDVVLADLMMPEMSGDQLLAVLRRDPEFAELPFMVLSARADEALRVRLLGEGAQDFVVKPFTLAELRNRVRNLVRAGVRRGELERTARAHDLRARSLGEDLVARNRELAEANAQLTASEGRLREALADKEVLLQEVHHRVKNNLQVVASLIHLQESALASPETRRQLQQCRDRVRTMALLHEMLFQGARQGRVDFAAFVDRLVAYTLRWHSAEARDVTARVDVDECTLGLEIAVPCGLIVHEWLSNSLEHAFPERSGGTLSIVGRYDPGAEVLTLEVGDDGIGVADEPAASGDGGLGLKLVERLTRQVGGSLRRREGAGTHWLLELAVAPREREELGVGRVVER